MGCKCSSRVAPVVIPAAIIPVKSTDRPGKPTHPTVEPADIDYDRLIDSILSSTQNGSTVKPKVADPDAFNRSFVLQRQQAIDNENYRSVVRSWNAQSLQDLASTIKAYARNKSMIDVHWIVFYWIASNITYDTVSYFSKNFGDQTAEVVFRTKKGVCAGYANLYKYLCDQLSMPCEIVGGYSKGYGFDQRAGAPTETDHAWNAVEIDQRWYLMESTWGAGILDAQQAFERTLNVYFFLPRPDEMIYHHLPENNRWQLLREPIGMDQYIRMPQLQVPYFELGLDLIYPRHQSHCDLLPDLPFALVLVRAPADVQLIASLKLNDVKVDGGHRVVFDRRRNIYCCYFAPVTVGEYKIMISGKRNPMKTDSYSGVIDLPFSVKQMPRNPISFPETWNVFHDLDLELISPKNTHMIVLDHGMTHASILLRAPKSVELMGRLGDSEKNQLEYGSEVYYDRHTDLWRCNFAPDRNERFQAMILAKRTADTTHSFMSAIAFKIEAKRLPMPALSYPKTWQSFYDLDLKIDAPRGRAAAVWPDNASFTEVRVQAPADVDISCRLEYNGTAVDNGALAQFDSGKQHWQLLFAPQRPGRHDIWIFARRHADKDSTSTSVAQLHLNVTRIRDPIQFPLTYTAFTANKCHIYEPLHGVLERGAKVRVHCAIPGATEIMLHVDSKSIKTNDYVDPILQTEIPVGSTDVAIYAKYAHTQNYDGLIRYSVR